MSDIKKRQAFLKSKGISDPINFYNIHHDEVPWFTQTLPGATRPLYKVPQNDSCLEPMSLSLGKASEQNPDMVNCLIRGPSILVNFGSGFTWMEPKAIAMASALAHAFEQTDLQVLWKFRKDITDSLDNVNRGLDYDDVFPQATTTLH
ncbi:hypothetical protein F5B20DRAFT_579378 [Whalleya microplaca]|nr:hypothetical protein F5B20DRAFT_579378 [Whalleya microplaca]